MGWDVSTGSGGGGRGIENRSRLSLEHGTPLLWNHMRRRGRVWKSVWPTSFLGRNHRGQFITQSVVVALVPKWMNILVLVAVAQKREQTKFCCVYSAKMEMAKSNIAATTPAVSSTWNSRQLSHIQWTGAIYYFRIQKRESERENGVLKRQHHSKGSLLLFFLPHQDPVDRSSV